MTDAIRKTNPSQTALNGQGNASKNGSKNGHTVAETIPAADIQRPRPFDQPVILRQSPRWAIYIVWAILGVTTLSVLWAVFAKVEETIPAQGKLEPVGVVQPVQTPSGGVIETIHVKEGDRVEAGDLLITFDQSSAQAELNSLREIRQQVTAETQFYRSQRGGSADAPATLADDLNQRIEDKNTLSASNRVYQAQLDGDASGLSPAQQEAVATARSNLANQQAERRARIGELEVQISQARSNLVDARSELATNEEILTSLRQLEADGAVARLSRLEQEQKVTTSRVRVDNLVKEIERLGRQVDQETSALSRAEGEFRENLQTQIRSNQERISAIDSNLGQSIIQNEGRLQEVDSRISQLETQLAYQELRAPVSGVVFNLKANQPGYAANSTEPILEIVPQETLVARVFIPNEDIGFVEVGESCQVAVEADNEAAIKESCKPVDVRIDAFSYSEFGDVDGYLTQIGSDALPPDELYPYYRFPAEIRLDSQALDPEGRNLQLRSGMALNANIKLRKRRVITFFTDLFVRKADSFRSGG